MQGHINFRPRSAVRSRFGELRTFSRTYLAPAILLALTFWLVFVGLQTFQKVVAYYTPLPMWDYWRVVDHLNDYESFHWAVLWQQHNEHRIVFPEIAFALDMLLLHGRMMLPLILSALSYFGTWLLLASVLLSSQSVPLTARLFALLLSGIIAFFESAAGVLAIPFLLQWTLMQLASAAAIVCASKLRYPQSTRYLALTIGACTVASYSSGNGLLLWPLVIVLATLVAGRKRDVLVLSAAAALTIGVYFIGYQFTGHFKLGSAIISPFYLARYLASYLSMPFGGMRTPGFGVKLGGCLIAALGALTVVAARTRRLTSHPVAVLLAYVCFTLVTAILTAEGRMDTSDPTFTAARAFRYLSVPQMNWAASVLLLFAVVSPLPKARRSLPALASAVAVLLWIALPKLSPWLGGVTSYLTEQQVATLEIESDLRDSHWIGTKLYPDVAFVQAMLSRLKAHRLSVYYGPRTGYLGRSLASVASVRPGERVPGQIVDARPVESGVELRGWADRSGRKLPAASLLLTDASGKIVGFGRQFPAGFPPVLASPDIPSSLAWVGFISKGMRATLISAYVEAPRGNIVYPLGQPMPINP